MRSFRCSLIISIEQKLCFGYLFSSILIKLKYSCSPVKEHISSSIIIIKYRWVNTIFIYNGRLAVWSFRLIWTYNYLLSVYITCIIKSVCSCYIKSSLIIRYIGSPVTSSSFKVIKSRPLWFCNSITYYLPVNKVFRMRYWYTRIEYKWRINHIIIIFNPDNWWVRIHTCPYWIVIHLT